MSLPIFSRERAEPAVDTEQRQSPTNCSKLIEIEITLSNFYEYFEMSDGHKHASLKQLVA